MKSGNKAASRFLQPYFVLNTSFFPCSEHTCYANNHKRNAELLPHIQEHVFLKIHLFLLQKFDEEAEKEDCGEAVSEIEACANG